MKNESATCQEALSTWSTLIRLARVPTSPVASMLRIAVRTSWLGRPCSDVTAPFVYARIMGTREDEPAGYSVPALDAWAERARRWAEGAAPSDLETVAPAPVEVGRDVFLYVISGAKPRNPAAAAALIERLG